MPRKLNYILFPLIFAISSQGYGEKWLNSNTITKKPSLQKESSKASKWLKERSLSIFKDGENMKLTKAQLDLNLAANPKDVLGFELINRQMSYGEQKSLQNLAKSFTEREVRKLDILESFTGGLSFKFDFGKSKAAKPKKKNDEINYSLVLEDIVPNPSRSVLRAALPTDKDY